MIVPWAVSPVSYQLAVILEDDNLKRIKEYDPAEVLTDKLGAPWTGMKLVGITIHYATTKEIQELSRCVNPAQATAMLRSLSRGWKYRPKEGDHDGNYGSVKGS